MGLLPFQVSDVVAWRDCTTGLVIEARGDRVVVITPDGMVHITTEAALRAMQPEAKPKPRGPGRAA